MRAFLTLSLLGAVVAATSSCSHGPADPLDPPGLKFPGEIRLERVRQLTQGGTNAEAYWSYDGKHLVFQHQGPIRGAPGPDCDQIYLMDRDGGSLRRLSNGQGRATCAFFLPGDERVLFSSTHLADPACPAPPDKSQGYVWPVYNSYQLHTVKPDGTDLIPFEPAEPRAYNAEATTCRDGSVVFTSDRDGDLELYIGKIDQFGTLGAVKRITHAPGYDGGAVFSPDCKRIAWRASRPRGAELAEYRRLLRRHLVRPGILEIWSADSDGAHARQVTDLGAASFAPTFTPDGRRILFASNPRDPRGRSFDLYLIHDDGSRLERVTYSGTFEGFPMFSPDGRELAFSSNRNGREPHETNVFVADWVERPERPLALDDASPADRFKALVERLSAPEMEGRGPGLAGTARAERLVGELFRKLGLKPLSAAFRKARIGFEGYAQAVELPIGASRKTVTAHNLVGAWGESCGKSAPIVIGAHLDHLGHGGPESLEPTRSGIHPGADDNASGVAAMIETARIISGDSRSNGASGCYVFAAFAGEEAGIAGSSRLTALFKKAGIRPKAMLNLDMVGRLQGNRLIVFGSDSAPEWRPLLEEKCSAAGLDCPGGGDGYGPSDHMAFYVAGTPVLHFFTGPHADYHRVTDTAEKINATGGIQVARLVAAVALQAGDPSQRLRFQKASATPTMGKLTGDPRAPGQGAYLGTIPDYSTLASPHGPAGGGEAEGGVRLAGTRSGSPADQAGVREGDVLRGIEAPTGHVQPIRTLQDFTQILRGLRPGDRIYLHLRRQKADLRLPAIVGKRE